MIWFSMFNTLFKQRLDLLGRGQFLLVEKAGVPEENHKPLIEKVTILVNKDWSQVHQHKQSTNSQP